MRKKQVFSALGTIYFGSPQLGHKIKTNCIKFQAFDPESCLNLIIQKKVWNKFLPHIFDIIPRLSPLKKSVQRFKHLKNEKSF